MASASHPSIVFAPASGPGVGGGHVMRCLTLAEALADRGCACTFMVGDDGLDLIARFGGGRFATRGDDPEPFGERFGVAVIDDYAASRAQQSAWRNRAGKVVVIDDLAERAHDANLLIDPSYGRMGADYADLLPDGAICLTGPAYALVKPAFAVARAGALARTPLDEPRRLFMSFGLSDVGGVAARAAAMVRARFPTVVLDVALSSTAESAGALRRRVENDPQLRLHVDAADMAALMSQADAAIGAGGVSTWERCCLGLPTLAVIVADNQRAMIRALAVDGALLAADLGAADFEAAFGNGLERLWDRAVRARLRAVSAGLCDGRGAERAAEAILAL